MTAVVELPVPFAETTIVPEALAAAGRVLASGWVTSGPEVVAFERELADYVGARHAVAVSSCTAAIELALRALRLPPGSRVLTSTVTFCGAVHAIVHAGHLPVLVDVDQHSLMPSPRTVAAATRLAGGAEALLAVHMAGLPTDVGALAAAAGLSVDRVVEDAAHALGATHEGRRIGSESSATCFSFYATKNLPIGEGGMVTTEDDDLAEHVRRARLHGMSADAWRRYLPGGSWRYTVEAPGLKANLTDVQAAIGRAQLPHFDAWQEHRRRLVAVYDEELAGTPGLHLPARAPGHAWHLYVVQITPEFGLTRDATVAALAHLGIGTSVHFIPLHHMPYFADLVPGRAPMPGADAVADRVLSLPLHQGLTEPQVRRVAGVLRSLPSSMPSDLSSKGTS